MSIIYISLIENPNKRMKVINAVRSKEPYLGLNKSKP